MGIISFLESFYKYAGLVLGLLGIFGITIEFTPTRFSPLKWLGNRMNGDLIARVEKIEKDNQKNYIARSRATILDFANSCRQGKSHTIEEFENIFDSISEYENYCETNHIENDKMTMQVQYLKSLYLQLSLQGNFTIAKETGCLIDVEKTNE